uniref:Testis expressed basic protein 1 n=1 Tax=Molossus molossus TaxID=27622 RepID=A0A7J8GTV1_MOLMO|nr:testis expressed basic protein 1 [Molossus molossus]
MAVLEVTLAVILTLLGLSILAILLTRWIRRKQNEIDLSRYNSEQSASLLDYEDGRGLRYAYSTESDSSYDDQERSKGGCTSSTNSPAPSRSGVGNKSLKGIPGAFSSTAGAIMQFSAPIPGATGPIKLTQKTIVQSPGPIVQYAGSGGPPLAPITISQRTSTIAPVAAVDRSGKITLSPMVIFPGYMDGDLAKQSDPRAPILKSGGTTKSKSSDEENKEALKKEISFVDSDKSLKHKKKSESRAKDIELEKEEIGMEAKVKKSKDQIPKEPNIKVKKSVSKTPQEQESQVEESEDKKPKGPKKKVKESEDKTPQEQESQVEESEDKKPKGPKKKVKESEDKTPQEQESQVEESEDKKPKGPKKKVKESEDKTPQDQESQVEKGEDKKPKGPKKTVKKESEISQGKESQVEGEAKPPKEPKKTVKKKESETPQGKESQCLRSKDTFIHHCPEM